ncbi:hypothetical protein Tco_0093945, partial [Tanacetum coccineum]
MAELARLYIYEELVDTWAWVASGPDRQPDAAVGALVDAEGAPDVDEGAQAIPAPAQAPQPPPTAGLARTMAQRLGRFTTWMISSLSLMMDYARDSYTSYSDFQIPYVRRTRRRT